MAAKESCLLQYICEEHFQNISGTSLFNGLKGKTHFGRPNFEMFFQAISNKHPKVGRRVKTPCEVMGVRWPSRLEHRTGDLVVLGSNPAGGTSLRNFYPTLPVSFGGH